ncbi:MAG: heme exporter protein CcmB, partial [Bacteroidota bacterium]
MLSEVLLLIQKDFKIDFRQGFALSAVLLFAITTVFICYKIFGDIQGQVWNAVYWIIFLFAALNAILKSFIQESGARSMYYFSLVNPIAVFLSKILYNTFFLFVLGILTYAVMGIFVGNPVRELPLFILTLFLGSLGISIAFTFVTAIGAKSN